MAGGQFERLTDRKLLFFCLQFRFQLLLLSLLQVEKGKKKEEEEEQTQKQKQVTVLTQPLSLEGGLAAEHLPPNVIQRVLSLFRSIRPGSDLTHFQVTYFATN